MNSPLQTEKGSSPDADWSILRSTAWILLVSAGASRMLLNFTGTTMFTSPSGVRREVRLALPAQIAVGAIGLIAWAYLLTTDVTDMERVNPVALLLIRVIGVIRG